VRKKKLEDGARSRARCRTHHRLLAPLEKTARPARKALVIMIAGVNGSGKTTSIGKLAQVAAGAGQERAARGGRHVPRRGARAAGRLGRAQQRAGDRAGSGDPGAVVFDALKRARARKSTW
jgi:fused signal recognition particle receptor